MKDLREGNGNIRENIMGMYGVKSDSDDLLIIQAERESRRQESSREI